MPNASLRKFAMIPLAVVLLFLFFGHSPAFAANTYDLATSGNWNIRIDGAIAGDALGFSHVLSEDIDNDGANDLIIPARTTDYNGADSGSIYIIYNTLLETLSGTGNTLDLSSTSNFNIRYDGSSGINFGRQIWLADLDNDGKKDLVAGAILADYNSRADSGSVWIVPNTLITAYSGVGNVVDITNASNYKIRYDGPQASNWFSYDCIRTGDIDGDGFKDLVFGSSLMDYGVSNNGAIWVIYNTLLSTYSGLGNTVDLNTDSNYNIRIVGAAASDALCRYGNFKIAPIDNDNKEDISIGFINVNTPIWGSAYFIYGSLLSQYSSTGNNLSMATITNYNIKWYNSVSKSTTLTDIGDYNSDDLNDLILGIYSQNLDSKTANGGLYLVNNNLFSSISGTGNSMDFTNSSNYNLRVSGANNNDKLGETSLADFNDFDGDSLNDLLVFTHYTDYNSRTDSGSTYLLYNPLINKQTTGNTMSLDSSANYSVRYDGPATQSGMPNFGTQLRQFMIDLDLDLKKDVIIAHRYSDFNSRTDSGSLYIIYNFPHTITANSLTTPSTSTSQTITGSVDAPDSVTTISGVEYQLDSNSPTSSWTPCSATDGAFDEKNEDYSCALTNLALGTHIIYFRSYDENTSYTPQSRYASVPVTIQTQAQASEEVTPNLAPSGVSESNDSDTAVLGEKTVTSSDEVSVNWDRPADTSNIDEYVVHYREIGSSTWKTETAGPESDSISWDPREGNWEWYLEIIYTDGSTSETSIYKFEVDQSSPENQLISIADEQMINLADEQGAGLLLPFGTPLIFNFGNTDWDTIIEIWNWDKTIHYTTMVCGSGICDHGDILTGPLTLVIYTVDEANNESVRREIKITPFGFVAATNAPAMTGAPEVRGATTVIPARSEELAPGIVRGAVDIDTSINPTAINNPGIVSGAVDFPEPEPSPEPPRQNIFQRMWSAVF